MSLTAAIDALRHDAEMWDKVAQVTRTAGQEAQSLALSDTELSWASPSTGLQASYAEIQNKVTDLLDQATTTYSGLSTTLDQVASAYQRSDADAATQFKGVWDVRD
jgi:hypothetical protein